MSKITAPAGYRELIRGETILATDSYCLLLPGYSVSGRESISADDLLERSFGDPEVGRTYNPMYAEDLNIPHAQFPTFRKLLDIPPYDPPAGYRWLKRGETVASDDVVVTRSCSAPATGFAGRVVGSGPSDLGDAGRIHGAFARHLGTPPAGYRLLLLGETVQIGDLFSAYPHDPQAYITLDAGCVSPGKQIGDPTIPDGGYARMIETPPAPSVGPAELSGPVGSVPREYPGAGFRFLDVGESIVEGDWVIFGEAVAPIRVDGCLGPVQASGALHPHGFYVRRQAVDAGTGYRLLQRGEKVEPGDEYRINLRGAEWLDLSSCFVGSDVAGWLRSGPTLVWRRKVSPPKPTKVDRPYTVPPGFRELSDGEIVEAGDYMLAKGEWVPRANTRRVGRRYEKGSAFVTIRSTVVAPAGYRLLGPSEETAYGDRYLVPEGIDAYVRSNLGKTWVSIGISSDWLGVVREVSQPEAPNTPPGLAFVGPVKRRRTVWLSAGRRRVTVARNAVGDALLTFVRDGVVTELAVSADAADAIRLALRETA